MMDIDGFHTEVPPPSPVSSTGEAATVKHMRRRDPTSWPALLDQDDASAFLHYECGVKLAPKTLQKRRVTGNGPPFQKIGSRVAYPRDPLKSWGDAQAGPVVHSTSELTSA